MLPKFSLGAKTLSVKFFRPETEPRPASWAFSRIRRATTACITASLRISETSGSKGLNEDIIRLISKKKEEPEWLLEFRLKAFRHWLTLKQPNWGHLDLPEIDYQDIIYYAAPRKRQAKQSLDEVDPELLATFDKLGISLDEQKKLSGVAVDAVMDSTSVKTTFQETLSKHGVIFMSFSEAVKQHPDLVRKYLGKAGKPIAARKHT